MRNNSRLSKFDKELNKFRGQTKQCLKKEIRQSRIRKAESTAYLGAVGLALSVAIFALTYFTNVGVQIWASIVIFGFTCMSFAMATIVTNSTRAIEAASQALEELEDTLNE